MALTYCLPTAAFSSPQCGVLASFLWETELTVHTDFLQTVLTVFGKKLQFEGLNHSKVLGNWGWLRSSQLLWGSSSTLRSHLSETGLSTRLSVFLHSHTQNHHMNNTDWHSHYLLVTVLGIFKLQYVPYIQIFQLWTCKDANLRSHAQSHKLAPVSGVHRHVCIFLQASAFHVLLHKSVLYREQ